VVKDEIGAALNSEEPGRLKVVVLQGVRYRVMEELSIKGRLFMALLAEWGREAFNEELPDMVRWNWKVETMRISDIKVWDELMRDAAFVSELEKRIVMQKDLITQGEDIEPIVVRGRDMVIYDGYARLYALKQLCKDEILAYVGREP
jgi:hypothetical protein